jgi:two-component system, sensor histidine kinase
MKTKILIVDDLRENILALSRLIEADDVELITAETPEEALNHVLDNDLGLALLDVQMPIMTGFELARLIRGVEMGKHLPIIFVTAQPSEAKLIFEGYESGAVDVLFKPLDPHIVRSKVQVFVRLDQQNRTMAAHMETMTRLKAEAESANVAKSRFLANMSHEIRTPLSAVLGFSDILSQGGLSAEDRAESLASISRNGKLLLRIIDDILDLSRIEAQKIELEKTRFDLDELLKDLEVTLSNKALDKGISLEFSNSAGKNRPYLGDPLRLKQILLNLIGNAIKFTHSGGVRVHSGCRDIPRLAESSPDLCELKFTIQDTGIGLCPSEAEKLFEPFAQADTSTRRKYGGTGLGLAISKQLARTMGGDVVLTRSAPGEGSTFEVTLKVPHAPESTETRASLSARAAKSRSAHGDAVSALTGKRILVVDDVPDNRILLERYLKPSGIVVQTASGGQEAIELTRTSEWDAVLMDIQMPNMDGYEATAQLRKLGFRKPIIALTAHAMKEELARCLKAGCDQTMTKPVAKKELIAKLAEALT